MKARTNVSQVWDTCKDQVEGAAGGRRPGVLLLSNICAPLHG